MLIGDNAQANTFPHPNNTATVEHEASTSKIGEDQLFYFSQGHFRRRCISMMISGFCKDVFNQLPMEFAGSRQVVEAWKEVSVNCWGGHLARLNEPSNAAGRLRHERRGREENDC